MPSRSTARTEVFRHASLKVASSVLRPDAFIARGVVSVLCTILVCSCGFFPESTFELAPKSRLPKWFSLPHDLTRGDVTVTMNYYVSPFGDSVTFAMLGPRKQVLQKVSGHLPPEQHSSGLTRYPVYEAITINGTTDIVEHRRMEPIFYLTDDPSVWAALASKR